MGDQKIHLVHKYKTTIMKNIISILALMLCVIACRAQQTYPLTTYYGDVPNYSYLKDVDNLLPPFIGAYKATYAGNEITLYITYNSKELIDTRLGNRKYYTDVLYIRYIVKKISTGTILQDTINPIDPKRNKIISIGIALYDNNAIVLNYSGTNCGVGNGSIRLKKPSDNQISWSYYPDDSLLDIKECPLSLDRTVYLPVAKDLIFTKQ